MQAARIHEHGGPDVLRVDDVPRPEPGPGEVLVRMLGVSVNHLDLWVRRGMPGLKIPMPRIPGCDGTGEIAYPLLGQVTAAGHTLEEIRAIISDDLDRDFVVDPRVSVEVLNFRPFFILGQVNAPGSYPFVAGLNVRQAVAIAGGFTRRGDQSEVVIVRDSPEGRIKYRATPNAPVLPGDTIEVRRRLF